MAPVSPTTSIRSVLIALSTAFLIALVFGSRGLVHAGNGMSDGWERTAVLGIGQPLQSITGAIGLTWPWDQAEALLGRTEQSGSPLLASGTDPTVPPAARPTATVTAKGGSGEGQKGGKGGTGGKGTSPVGLPPQILQVYRIPTRSNPLRLLTTGDSLSEFIGNDLINATVDTHKVVAWTEPHYGTGLVRPDFVDWSVVARQQVAAKHPDAVVVMMGGNDYQNLVVANGKVLLTNTHAWMLEYQRRAEVCMRIWTQGGKAHVYWLSMPPAREAGWTQNNALIDQALQRAAANVPGVKYLNILGPVTNHGAYADFVTYHGQPTLVREPDGIHFNEAGSQIVSDEVLRVLNTDWRLGIK